MTTPPTSTTREPASRSWIERLIYQKPTPVDDTATVLHKRLLPIWWLVTMTLSIATAGWVIRGAVVTHDAIDKLEDKGTAERKRLEAEFDRDLASLRTEQQQAARRLDRRMRAQERQLQWIGQALYESSARVRNQLGRPPGLIELEPIQSAPDPQR